VKIKNSLGSTRTTRVFLSLLAQTFPTSSAVPKTPTKKDVNSAQHKGKKPVQSYETSWSQSRQRTTKDRTSNRKKTVETGESQSEPTWDTKSTSPSVFQRSKATPDLS
ncbi:protein kinase superfamily protein, partial [Striga asiatica]